MMVTRRRGVGCILLGLMQQQQQNRRVVASSQQQQQQGAAGPLPWLLLPMQQRQRLVKAVRLPPTC